MKKQIGVWIDRRRAVVVMLRDGKETIREIPSNVPPRVRLSGGSRSKVPYGPQDIVSETRRDRKHALEIKHYYRDVSEHLRGAEEILIFGPGDARRGLHAALADASGLASRVVGVEPAGKMTDRQIAAFVRTHFGVPKRTRKPPATMGSQQP